METKSIKISDALGSQYTDFLVYCSLSGKVFTSDLTNVDYVAFRTSAGQTRQYIDKIKTQIERSVSDTQSENVEELQSSSENESATRSTDAVLQGLDNTESFPAAESDEAASKARGYADIAKNTTVLLSSDSDQSAKINEEPAEEPSNSQEAKQRKKYLSITVNGKITLASLVNANPEDYCGISIEYLDLSIRPLRCLDRVGCTTIDNLLCMTVEEIGSLRNMGSKSVNEIISRVREYVSNPMRSKQSLRKEAFGIKTDSPTLETHGVTVIDDTYRSTIEMVILGEEVPVSQLEELTDAQIGALQRLKIATDVIGGELGLEAYLNPEYAIRICDALSESSAEYVHVLQMVDAARKRVYDLPEETRKKALVPLLLAYAASSGDTLSFLLTISDSDTKISQLPRLLEKLWDSKLLNTALKRTDAFLDWADFDIQEQIRQIVDRIQASVEGKDERAFEVFSLRTSGKTLEEIGSLYGVTRERIRQIEIKAHRAFWSSYQRQRCDLIMLISALRNGDRVLVYEEVHALLGDFAQILWACLRQNPNHDFYYYTKTLDAIIIKVDCTEEIDDAHIDALFDNAFNKLPEVIENEKVSEWIEAAASGNPILSELVQKEFKRRYKKTGRFYHSKRITVVFICDYVLKHYFPNGFKIADDMLADRFRECIAEAFDEKASSVTNRALDARVSEVGVLCDRGKYIHPDYLQVDPSIMEAVNDFIEQSPRNILLYAEIYEGVKDILAGTQITSRYWLQGALQKYGCRFSTTRDFVRKTQSVSFVDELDAFVAERGEVHKSEIFATFTSLEESGLGQVVARSSNVFNIENGYYIHASKTKTIVFRMRISESFFRYTPTQRIF